MAIREVGPSKTYADIAAAATAASSGDTIRCFFDTADSSFVLSALDLLTIEAAPGYTPSWLRAGTLMNFQGTDLTISGITIGRSDNGYGSLLAINAYSTAARTITVENCALSFGSGTPSIVSATALAVGTTTFAVNVTGCSMAQTTNKLNSIAGIAGNDPTTLGRMALTITESSLRTNGIRAVSSNGLFAAQTLRKSIIKVSNNDGQTVDFAAGSTSTIEQSILDGAGVGLSLVTCDCSKTTLSIKSSYILRSAGTAVTITNHTPGAYGIVNSLLYGNTTAAINCASTVTDHCQFGSNGADYAGGGTINATDSTGAVPTFTDIATGDYSPTGVSSTRNAGIDMGFTTDIRGEAIPQGSDYDIGPYEFPEITTVRLTNATASTADAVVIEADGDLTNAISDPLEWAVAADTPGIPDPAIDSITIGAPNTQATIAFTADLTPREYYTITTTSTDVEAGFRTLQFQTPADGARLVSAMFVPTINAIAVAADLPLTTASNGTSKWSISVVDGFGDQLTLTQAQIQGTGSQVIGLTYDGTPTPGAKYIITTTSTDFETGYTTGYAVVALDDQDFTPEPLLPTMLSAIGKQIAVDTGFPQTVLTAFLTPGDTTAYVESTLNFPNTDGILYINGVRIDYTTKTANTFEGLIWETTSDGVNDYYLNTEVILDGSPVMDYSQTYSLQDKATNENIVNRSFGKELKRLAKSLGFPVPLASMTDTDIQEYLNERMYQPTGIPSAIFRTLRPVLRALELTGTATVSDAVTITGVIMNNPLQVMQMLGRWVEINGRIAKIFNATLTAPDTYTWEFVAYDGYCWQHPTLTEVGVGNSVAWRLIPYLFNDVVTETITNLGPFVGNVNFDRAAQFDLHLFVGNQMPAGYPTGYWLEDHTVDMPGGGLAPTDGRSIHNYLADTHLTEATADDRFLYLLDDYDYEIAELLSDLLPAGVIGNVIVHIT